MPFQEDNGFDETAEVPTGEIDTREIFGTMRAAAIEGMQRLHGQFTDTDLAKEVKAWRGTIGPELAKEADLPEFNIRNIIHQVDARLMRDDDAHTFSELVQDRPFYERGRVFSSMLQMANEGKLLIIQPDRDVRGTEEAIEAFRVKTLRERQHVAGDDVAGSAAQKRLRAPSSPHSSQSPHPKRKSKN